MLVTPDYTLHIVKPFAAAPTTLTTETVLQVLTDYGKDWPFIAFTLRNHDASDRAAFFLDRSNSGVVAEDERLVYYIAPARERTFEFRESMFRYWGLSAAGDPEASFPSVDVSFQIMGRRVA